MKKILILILLVMISGCQFNNDKGNLPDTSKAYIGTDGLVITFLENAPPVTVPAGSYVPVGLFLENKGAVDIKNGVVVLSYPKDILTLEQNSFPVNIEGKETYAVGGKQVNLIDGKTKDAKDIDKIGTAKPKARITATSCYDYATKLSAGLCINPDPYNIKRLSGRKPACESKALTFSGQGAPVGITKVDSITIPKENTVDINIKAFLSNRNTGVIYRKGGGNTYCTSGVSDLNIVYARASLLGKDVACTPAAFKLSDRNDENYVTCIFKDVPAPEAFVTQLSIVLEYGYSSTISKDIGIEVRDIKCDTCETEGYMGIESTPACQSFGDASYLTALHKKCVNGCIELYPDFTTQPPTAC